MYVSVEEIDCTSLFFIMLNDTGDFFYEGACLVLSNSFFNINTEHGSNFIASNCRRLHGYIGIFRN